MGIVPPTWIVVVGVLLGLCANEALAQGLREANRIEVESQKKPGSTWKTYDATTVEGLLGAELARSKAPALSAYGGLLGQQYPATGYFYAKKIHARWWLIDPQGHPLIRMGLNAVYRRTRSSGVQALPPELREHVQAEGGRLWAAEAVDVLRDLGVNSLGRWSEYEVFNETGARIPYTTSLKFMATFGKELGVTHAKYGHMGYRDNCIPVFHPDFPKFCEEYARESVAHLATDPYLVGHYTDNEMPVPRNLLEITLSLDSQDEALKYNRQAAWDWYRQRRGKDVAAADATTQDSEAYLGYVYHRYYELTSAALRRHDPNHLVMGSRLHGAGVKIAPVVEAAGKHLDVVSFNTYGYWEVPDHLMDMWAASADRPYVISEFCIKGQDSGLPNEKGAGWIVRTQHERGVWYQNFVIGLLRSKNCVGWDYFKYRDDPEVNKGVLTVEFKPHPEFYAAMKQVHEAAYLIVEQIDSD